MPMSSSSSMGGQMEGRLRQNTPQEPLSYRQILSKEVAKSSAEDAGLPSPPVSSKSIETANGTSDLKLNENPKESSSPKHDTAVSALVKPTPIVTSSVKNPLGAKKTGKTGGLGARKLSTKTNENLYDQKPEEPFVQVSTSASNTPSSAATPHSSRFEYVDVFPDAETGPDGMNTISHVAPPKSSRF